jgi:SAM-dependent methyltransferase
MDVLEQMERVYGRTAPQDIPWNRTEPPDLLRQLVESRFIAPCEAVDLGCGLGHYATWLASKGFRVTGIDISPTAIEQARRQASAEGASCRFVVADLRQPVAAFDAAFDFAYDWEVLHHVFQPDRPQYVANVHRMLRPGGRYLSVCFSQEDTAFGGAGKVRGTPFGTVLYFSSKRELRDLFAPVFELDLLGVVDIPGTTGSHRAIRALMRKRAASESASPTAR